MTGVTFSVLQANRRECEASAKRELRARGRALKDPNFWLLLSSQATRSSRLPRFSPLFAWNTQKNTSALQATIKHETLEVIETIIDQLLKFTRMLPKILNVNSRLCQLYQVTVGVTVKKFYFQEA